MYIFIIIYGLFGDTDISFDCTALNDIELVRIWKEKGQ
jgi:hypothetical protein